MQEMLATGSALDVRKIGTQVGPGLFRLRFFKQDVDYCDVKEERWIWSIAKEEKTGLIFAAYDTTLYQKAGFTNLFLR